jgi:hypothetical protein
MSPTVAAGRPLINTLGEPVAITKLLQCGTPESPSLAAAGIFYLHKLLKFWQPRIYFLVLLMRVWFWWDFRTKLNHVIKSVRYLFVLIICV